MQSTAAIDSAVNYPLKMGKGGARREKVPEVDTEHLTDSLLSHVKCVGVQSAFLLGRYHTLEVQQAVSGPDLVDNCLGVIKALHRVQPSLMFKYSDLVGALKEVLRQFPGIKDSFTVSEQPTLWKVLSERLLVVCNHSRRVGREKAKYQEAGSRCTNHQLQKLEEIWNLFNHEVKEKKAVQVSPAKSAQSQKTDDLLDEFEVPATQESLLAEAEEVEPIPPRKRALRELAGLKKPASCKRPAASASGSSKDVKKKEAVEKKKKVGLPDEWKLADEKVTFMTYPTGAAALRLQKGKQILQVMSAQGPEHSKALATQCLKKLKEGQSLGSVKAWKNKALKK